MMGAMSTLYERIAGTRDGEKRLAVARLRREALRALHVALEASGLSQGELAARLGIREPAAGRVLHGDSSLRVETIAEYLHALGASNSTCAWCGPASRVGRRPRTAMPIPRSPLPVRIRGSENAGPPRAQV